MVIGPGEEYLSWILPALCTSTGHFLSVHKSTLQEPASIFSFLGFEFNIEKQHVSVPSKRKEKIRTSIREILKTPICDFSALEKLRGKFCSLALVCPLTRLNIRAITHALTLYEHILQPEVQLTPAIMSELETWLNDPFFLDAQRPFDKIGEKDIIFRPKLTTSDGLIEYHTGKNALILIKLGTIVFLQYFLDASGYRMGCYDVQTGRK